MRIERKSTVHQARFSDIENERSALLLCPEPSIKREFVDTFFRRTISQCRFEDVWLNSLSMVIEATFMHFPLIDIDSQWCIAVDTIVSTPSCKHVDFIQQYIHQFGIEWRNFSGWDAGCDRLHHRGDHLVCSGIRSDLTERCQSSGRPKRSESLRQCFSSCERFTWTWNTKRSIARTKRQRKTNQVMANLLWDTRKSSSHRPER